MNNNTHPSKFKAWIEAMRLRTLPVSVAGVFAGIACALRYGNFRFLPAIICLLFAILAQIVANFANEYYDYIYGLDTKGREGFRRGVTEGDLSPKAMKHATFLTLAVALLSGLSLIHWGGWWLIAVGAVIGIFALSYSTGPYPLSHHGLGDIAVIIFFGIVPVVMTAYLQSSDWTALPLSLATGCSIGMLGANVLIINNYRDMESDQRNNKRTTVVIFGRTGMQIVYIVFGITGTLLPYILLHYLFDDVRIISIQSIVILLFACTYIKIGIGLTDKRGAVLNATLRDTSLLLLLYSIYLLIIFF